MHAENYKKDIEVVSVNATIRNFLVEYFESVECETENISWNTFYEMLNAKGIVLKDAYEISRALRRLMVNNYDRFEFRGEKDFNTRLFFDNYDFKNELPCIITEDEWAIFCEDMENYIAKRDDYIAAWVFYIYRHLLWHGENYKSVNEIKQSDVHKTENGVAILNCEFSGQFWNESYDFIISRFNSSPSKILVPALTKSQKKKILDSGVFEKVFLTSNHNIKKSGELWTYFKNPHGDVTLFQKLYLERVREHFL